VRLDVLLILFWSIVGGIAVGDLFGFSSLAHAGVARVFDSTGVKIGRDPTAHGLACITGGLAAA
jgi:hypothetical protein